jgi:predicted DsbA family dithiol-disulfide isomerase
MADQAGLPVGERTHWFDSEPAHEASEWAREQGTGEQFRHAIYEAYFVKNINIGSPDVLVQIANDLGLDGENLREALADKRYQNVVTEQFQEAHQIGVTGVPTFVAGGYAVVGAQPYEMFVRLMETVGAERRSNTGDEQ